MALGVDIHSTRDKAMLSESPIFDALVQLEEYAGPEQYMKSNSSTSDEEFNRKFYWRSIRLGVEHPNPALRAEEP